MPASALGPSERQGETSERVPERKEPEKHVDKRDHQDTGTKGYPDTPPNKGEEHQSGRNKSRRKRARRGEAWVRRHATAIEAASAVVIAFFTAALFAVGWWQWGVMHETLVSANRAWLVYGSGSLTQLCAGQTLNVKLTVKNVGNGPAFNVGAVGKARFSRDNVLRTAIPRRVAAREGHIVIGPGEEAGLAGVSIPPMRARKVEAITSGRLQLLLYGRMVYRDRFAPRRWTTFCLVVKRPPATGFSYCRNGNDAN
jgi:hypothetical protein